MTVLEAITEYKDFVKEINHLFVAFSSVSGTSGGYLVNLGWTVEYIKGYNTKVGRYDPAKRIKESIIGDMPEKEELQKRLFYVWYELSGICSDTGTNYFPGFPEDFFTRNNKELLNTLEKEPVENYAIKVLPFLRASVIVANIEISNVLKMLREISIFAGIDEKVVLSDEEALVKIDGIHLSGGEQEKKSQPVTKKKIVTKNKNEKFSDIIQCDRPNFIERLHFLIDGKGGKNVGLVFRRALDLNYIISKPTQGQFESEFELKGTWPSIYKYMVDDKDGKNKEKANKIVIFEDE